MGIFKNFDRNRWLYNGLIGTFVLLYAATAFVSFYHAITFFNIANAVWLSVLLSFVAEIGQASVLFGILLTDNKKKYLPWLIMFILTSLQVIGNVVSSFDWIVAHNDAGLDGFKRSILFAVQTDDPEMFRIIVAWISGALLPIIALSMTALVAQNMNLRAEDKKKSQELPKPPVPESNESNESKDLDVKIEDNQIVDAKDIISEVSKIRPTEEDLAILENILAFHKPITEIPKEEEPEEKIKEEVTRIKEIMNKVEKIQSKVVDSNFQKEQQEETPEYGAPFDEPITYIEPVKSSSPYEPMDEYKKEITSLPLTVKDEEFDENDFDLPDDEEDEFGSIDLTDIEPDKILPEFHIKNVNGLAEDIVINQPIEEKIQEIEKAPEDTPPIIEPEKKPDETPEIQKPVVPPPLPRKEHFTPDRLEKLRQIARDNLKKK